MTTFKATTDGTDKLGLHAVLERYANDQWLPDYHNDKQRVVMRDDYTIAAMHPATTDAPSPASRAMPAAKPPAPMNAATAPAKETTTPPETEARKATPIVAGPTWSTTA